MSDETTIDGKCADGGGQVAAVPAPVDERLVDGHLTEEVVHVVVRLCRLGQDHGLAGAGGSTAHAVNLLLVRVRAADHTQQEVIPGFARDLCRFRQILQPKEHALAGAATHVGGGNFYLGRVGHAAPSDCRKSSAKR